MHSDVLGLRSHADFGVVSLLLQDGFDLEVICDS